MDPLRLHTVKHIAKMTTTAVAGAVLAGAAVMSGSDSGFPQSINSCSMEGNASQGTWQWTANPLKNRYAIPEAADIDPAVTFDGLLHGASAGSFDQSKAADVNGYIWYVKVGGTETCNCGSTSPPYMDTHIYVCATVPPPNPVRADLERQSIIVEVTPRLRQIMASNGVDWSTSGVDKSFTNQPVRITGWLFYDKEHEPNSQINNPTGAHNWRGSCWEIHPVTSITLAGSVDIPANRSATLKGTSAVPNGPTGPTHAPRKKMPAH